MLIDYIEEPGLIQCKVSVSDWEEAVVEGCRLLEEEGYLEDAYKDAIIEMTREHGPYYVICPGVAMPHSRPEAGVKKKGISLMTLKKPVAFGSDLNDPVSVVITLAATDNQSHLDLMQAIVELLTDETNVTKLAEADSVEAIRAILS